MSPIPYTLLSSAISLDGFLDDTSSERLILSNKADLDRVDAVRASCDAILVGANTIRADNPRLRIRSAQRIQGRLSAGKPENLIKASLTSSGAIPATAQFFSPSDNHIFIYCTEDTLAILPESIKHYAVTLPGKEQRVDLRSLLEDLKQRGVDRLLIEGGQKIATAFLTANLVHEFQLAIAPFFLGEQTAPRFVGPGAFPYNTNNRMHLDAVKSVGDMAVLIYTLHSP